MRNFARVSLLLAPMAVLACSADPEGPAPSAAPTSPSSSASAPANVAAPRIPAAPPTTSPTTPNAPPVVEPAKDELLVHVEGARPAGALRVATVWLTVPSASALTPDPTFTVGASAPLPAALPGVVRVPATPPPPRARALSANGDYFAIGRVLVYDDTNGNGTFDLVPAAGATAFVDRIVGYAGARAADPATGRENTSTYSIGYVHGAAPSAGVLAGATQGFSVVRGAETGGPVVSTVLPLTTPLPVKLVDRDALSCAGVTPLPSGDQGGLRLDNVISAPVTGLCPGNTPLPLGAVRCTAPGLNFYLSSRSLPTSAFVRAACGEVLETCVVRSSETATPGPLVGARPAGWPCP